MSDGSVVHTCGSKIGGILEPVTPDNYKEFGMLRLMDSPKMKGLLNTVSMPNWYHCSVLPRISPFTLRTTVTSVR